ncbi:MAG TPA: hypothetical protein VGG56_17395 [Terracidiphilus sp.]|jgi:hypothetical protein
MKPTEQTKRHVISTYVEPARRKGEQTIQVRVGNIQKELGWTNRTPSVFSTLSSKEFQQEAGVQLIERFGGPPSGGPSTTWRFVFQILGEDKHPAPATKMVRKGDGLRDLYGLCAETFKALGGGEEFLRREREWGPDVWERYEAEKLERPKAEAAK